MSKFITKLFGNQSEDVLHHVNSNWIPQTICLNHLMSINISAGLTMPALPVSASTFCLHRLGATVSRMVDVPRWWSFCVITNAMGIPELHGTPIFNGSGGQDRTADLGVMNPTL